MVYKILFILTIFSYVVNMQELDFDMPSKLANTWKSHTYEKNIDENLNEKKLQDLRPNTKIMSSLPNKSMDDIESPIFYLNINKFNIRQYKDPGIATFKKELMFDTISTDDNLNMDGTSKNNKLNTTESKSNNTEDTEGRQKNIKIFERRLLPNTLDKLGIADVQTPTKKYSSNETGPLNTYQSNDLTNCTVVQQNSREKIYKMILDSANIIYKKESLANDHENSDVTESRDAATTLCYVCNSDYDSSCWSPGKKTVTKYCHEKQQLCLTHLYKQNGAHHVVRDCGNSCQLWQMSTTFNKTNNSFTSCTLCHTDLCNSAYYLKTQNFVYLILILFKLYFN